MRIEHDHTIDLNQMVYRQTRQSKFTYYTGEWHQFLMETVRVPMFYLLTHGTEVDGILQCNDYASMTMKLLDGYRDGVKILEFGRPNGLPNFKTSIVPMSKDIELIPTWGPRASGERFVRSHQAYGKKQTANYVQIILYHRDTLLESDSERNLTGADWEVISINGRLYEEPDPQIPYTMARNQLAYDPVYGVGGTQADYTGEQFARAMMFWNDHIMIKEH
jgi:hypothetical protein